MRYQAKLINNGHIEQTMAFDAPDPISAWNEANDGIDPLTGRWVCCRPAPTPRKMPDPAKFAPKPGAQREYNATGQGNSSKDSSSGA